MSMEPVPLDNPTPPSSEKRRTVLREALGVFAVVALIAWALLRFFTGVPGEHRFSLHAPSQAAVGDEFTVSLTLDDAALASILKTSQSQGLLNSRKNSVLLY